MINLITKATILFLFVLTGCAGNKKMSAQQTNNNTAFEKSAFDKQGHRGCRGLMPENTIPGMLHAIELGVTTLEMDIVFSKDGKAVLSHEPFFNHEITTKPDGTYINEIDEKNFNIYEMNYDEIQKFDVGLKPHPRFPQQQKMKATKPLLTDLLDSITLFMSTRRRPMPNFNIETKTTPATDDIFHPRPETFVDNLIKIITDKGITDRTTIQSFDIRTLIYLHKKYPDIKTALLIEDTDRRSLDDQLAALGFSPTIYSPASTLVTEQLIGACHNKNIKIIPWTVNDKATIEKLKAMGVDGIISDYPDLLN